MRKLRILTVVILITIFTSLLSGCLARMPLPSVKEGRFDFSVTYEVDGEVKTYSGVYVCEFDGAYKTLAGEGVDWEGYIENGDDKGIIPIQTNDDGIIYIDLYFVPEYFMDDPDAICYDVPAPALVMVYHSDDPDVSSYETDAEILETNYGVKIISYKYADPIKNTFKETFTFVDSSCNFRT
jgi:hypothetical protein